MSKEFTIENCDNHYISLENGSRFPDHGKIPDLESLYLYAPKFIEKIYELDVIKHLINLIPSGGVFLDVGAHIGFYSIGLAKNFKKIIAFEPSPFQYKYLIRNISENNLKNIEPIDKVVSSSPGNMIELFITGRSGGTNTVEKSLVDNPMKKISVETISIDSMNLEDLTLLKIDVEGHEIEALHGALITIKNYKPIIICEVWDNKKSRQAFNEIMKELNYGHHFFSSKHPELAICKAISN